MAPANEDDDPVIRRLEDQIAWYDRKSAANQTTYKRLKVVEIVAAAVIPFLAALDLDNGRWAIGALGVIITIFEGLLSLNQYQQNWIAYRSTCEALKHEKFAFLARASSYANVENARALLG